MLIDKDIDRDGQLKLYVQIYDIIRLKIEEGEWLPNSIIPSEEELCKIFSVSKVTVRLALSNLVRDGYLRRYQGKGSFVRSPIPYSGITMKTRITDNMFRRGVRGMKESLEAGVREPDQKIREYLDYTGTVLYAQCRGSEEGEPVCIEELFAPLAYFPGIENEEICGSSFFNVIKERSSRKLSQIVQTVEVSKLKGRTARLLRAAEGQPSLLMHKVFIDTEDRPMAYVRLQGKAGKFRGIIEFERIR